MAAFKHIETFDIGSNIFMGAGAYIQGRSEGNCSTAITPGLARRPFWTQEIWGLCWLGPGAEVLGSQHTGLPISDPVITTDLEIKPDWIKGRQGTNATILPGVCAGAGMPSKAKHGNAADLMGRKRVLFSGGPGLPFNHQSARDSLRAPVEHAANR